MVHFNKNTVINQDEIGHEMYQLVSQLYPVCRSITGDGVRDTLNIINEHIPVTVHEVPTGKKVFDWTIPKEWNIRDAYIKNKKGEKIVDFKDTNLHVLNYSIPVNKKVSLTELKEHLFTIPQYPEWIPYRTSYYKEDWGFCVNYNQYQELTDEMYDVCIDSSLEDGHLTYGEYYIKGESLEEVLVSCHICHPSLCNDNLSSIAVTTFLAKQLQTYSLRYSYRFLFIPATIGAIAWLAINESNVTNIKHGLVAANLGDQGKFHYKKSRGGDQGIDKVVTSVLKSSGSDYQVMEYSPYGYDERQYCSPGFNLPIGSLMRTPHGIFPEYHTSADNLDFVKPDCLADSLKIYHSIMYVLENNKKYINLFPKCEPQLGKRGLYEKTGGGNENQSKQLAMLWVLNLSDGEHTLLDISNRSGFDFGLIKDVADLLFKSDLLKEHSE